MALRFAYQDSIEPSRPLPEGWVAFKDDRNEKEYYYHAATGETTWDHPEELSWFSKIKMRMKDSSSSKKSSYLGEPAVVDARSSDNAVMVPMVSASDLWSLFVRRPCGFCFDRGV